jgi:hypothetical protein
LSVNGGAEIAGDSGAIPLAGMSSITVNWSLNFAVD